MENSRKFYSKFKKFLYKNKYVKALFYILKYLEVSPNDASGWSALALVYYFMGKFQESINAAHKALEIESELKSAFNYLFLAYDQVVKYQEAIELLREYIEIYDLD